MKKVLFSCVLMLLISLCGCSSGNYKDVKEHAVERWAELGFDVVGCDGYTYGFWGFGDYGGAKVWYVLTKKNGNKDITYGGYLWKWGKEYHMYNLTAYDAISPQTKVTE